MKAEAHADLGLGGSVPHLLPQPHEYSAEGQGSAALPHLLPQQHVGRDTASPRGVDRQDPSRRSLPSVRADVVPQGLKSRMTFTPRHESSV